MTVRKSVKIIYFKLSSRVDESSIVGKDPGKLGRSKRKKKELTIGNRCLDVEEENRNYLRTSN